MRGQCQAERGGDQGSSSYLETTLTTRAISASVSLLGCGALIAVVSSAATLRSRCCSESALEQNGDDGHGHEQDLRAGVAHPQDEDERRCGEGDSPGHQGEHLAALGFEVAVDEVGLHVRLPIRRRSARSTARYDTEGSSTTAGRREGHRARAGRPRPAPCCREPLNDLLHIGRGHALTHVVELGRHRRAHHLGPGFQQQELARPKAAVGTTPLAGCDRPAAGTDP